MRIIGIDPGSRLLGYACIDGKKILCHGTLIKKEGTMEARLQFLYEELCKVIREHKPTHLAIEKIFFAKNALSALKLGQARGVVLLAAAQYGLKVFEYSATEVKKTITGHGHAEKTTVAQWIKMFTGEAVFQTLDSSDALAIALCHSFFASNSATPAAKRGGGKRSLSGALDHLIKLDASK